MLRRNGPVVRNGPVQAMWPNNNDNNNDNNYNNEQHICTVKNKSPQLFKK